MGPIKFIWVGVRSQKFLGGIYSCRLINFILLAFFSLTILIFTFMGHVWVNLSIFGLWVGYDKFFVGVFMSF